jgi:hypothetical protein
VARGASTWSGMQRHVNPTIVVDAGAGKCGSCLNAPKTEPMI